MSKIMRKLKQEKPTAIHSEIYVRQVAIENKTCQNRYSYCNPEDCDNLVCVAIAIDKVAEANIDKIGCCGTGAGAYLEFIEEFNGDPDEGEVSWSDEITSALDQRLNGHLIGTMRELGMFMTSQHAVECYDGNNHVPAPLTACEELRDWMREHKTDKDSRFLFENPDG